jgi:hypothetical protein
MTVMILILFLGMMILRGRERTRTSHGVATAYGARAPGSPAARPFLAGVNYAPRPARLSTYAAKIFLPASIAVSAPVTASTPFPAPSHQDTAVRSSWSLSRR